MARNKADAIKAIQTTVVRATQFGAGGGVQYTSRPAKDALPKAVLDNLLQILEPQQPGSWPKHLVFIELAEALSFSDDPHQSPELDGVHILFKRDLAENELLLDLRKIKEAKDKDLYLAIQAKRRDLTGIVRLYLWVDDLRKGLRSNMAFLKNLPEEERLPDRPF